MAGATPVAALVGVGEGMTERMTAEEYRKHPPRVAGHRVTPETALKHACVEYLRLQGWLTYAWFQQGMVPKNLRGMPDRIAIKGGRHVWLEFKSPQGKLSSDQELRIEELRAAGAEVLVVRSLEHLFVLGDERQMVMK